MGEMAADIVGGAARRAIEPLAVDERALTLGAAELFARFAPQIAAVPPGERLTRAELQVPEFLLHRAGRLAIYYAPFDFINPRARVVLVGITPGFRQMEIALRASRDALLAGETDWAAICARVKYQASFAGPIRRFLLAMLDGIGVPAALDIPASAALYAGRADLLQTSAVVRHPVFVGGADWTGHTPPVRGNPILRRYLWEVLLPELRAVPGAIIVSLGKCCVRRDRDAGRGGRARPRALPDRPAAPLGGQRPPPCPVRARAAGDGGAGGGVVRRGGAATT
jgi:hypothetical protein